MRVGRLRAGGSRNLALVLLAVTGPPAAMLAWLGWQLLQQDRALLTQRDFERRQAAAQAAVHSLQLSLAEAQRHILEDPVPPGMVRFRLSSDGVIAQPADRVAWLPRSANHPPEDNRFVSAEALEFQGDIGRAAAAYEEASRSSSPGVRGGALLRLARVRRRQKHWDDAVRAYRDLQKSDAGVIEGAPADLQARRALCAVLEEAERTRDLKTEAARLEADLVGGRWSLDRPAWELTVTGLERWTGRAPAVSSERILFSSVADTLWREPRVERHVVMVGNDPVTLVSRDRSDGTVALLAISPRVLGEWIDRAVANGSTASAGTGLNILGSSGETVLGPPPSNSSATIKVSAADSALPWTIAVHVAPFADAELTNRRRLLSAGLAAILLLLAGGSYFLWRVVQRELAVARLQGDFVSAVSHEFRTPLTSLRHVTELLEEHDEMPADRRAAFYEALRRNTERLHRLVESLLDFGRMESGRKPYDLRPLDVTAFVTDLVSDFRREVSPRGFAVDVDIHVAPGTRVRADAEVLANALWNLLDNAVKYSGDSREIHVSADARPAGVAVSVRDEGLGVSAHERKEIFGRFVRGERAIQLGIKGTGLGLAMVSHIVRAHGGTIELVSEESAGSAFTIVLPAI